MPRRDIDQEPLDLALADRLEMPANRRDVPAMNVRISRLDNVPRLAHEGREASLAPSFRLPPQQFFLRRCFAE